MEKMQKIYSVTRHLGIFSHAKLPGTCRYCTNSP